jgi:hypothetical protein
VNMKIGLCNGFLLESGTDKLFPSSSERLKIKQARQPAPRLLQQTPSKAALSA